MRVDFLANVCIVSDQTSEVGNVKYCPQLHAWSDLRFIIRLQEDARIVPIRPLGWATEPRFRGIIMRVEFLGTDNSWPWAPTKKLFGVAQLKEPRSCASSIINMTSWNLTVDSCTKKYVIFYYPDEHYCSFLQINSRQKSISCQCFRLRLAQRRLKSLCVFCIMLFVKSPPWGARKNLIRAEVWAATLLAAFRE